jgi:hypothetical protein
MGNAIFEQYGYKSAYDLMTDLSRDITDGGDLLAVRTPKGSTLKQVGYAFDGGYWLVTYRRGRVTSIGCFKNDWEMLFVMGV